MADAKQYTAKYTTIPTQQEDRDIESETTLATQDSAATNQSPWQNISDLISEVFGRVLKLDPYSGAMVVFLIAGSNAVTYSTVSKAMRNDWTCLPPVNMPPEGPGIAKFLMSRPKPSLMNNTLFDHDHSVFIQHSSSDADEAWKEYSQVNNDLVFVPRDQAKENGIDPDRHVYLDEPKFGMVGYPVGLTAVHQMHCLNMLRMNLYYNKNHSRASCLTPGPGCGDTTDEYYENHIDHCIQVLRRRLACTADLGVYPYFWIGREGLARESTCGNFNGITDWVRRHPHKLPHFDERKEVRAIKPKANDYVMDEYI